MQSPDYAVIIERTCKFIRRCVDDAKADGVIFGLSGGIDSAVIAHLCKRAIGNHCLALIMPNYEFTPRSETDDGILVATKLHLKYKIRPIQYISNLFTAGDADGEFRSELSRKLTIGNLNARIRAVMLYYEGQKRNYLVVGTDDKSEYLIGYFTKYGDGASDLLPIAELYKTQVKELARHLGVPNHIIEKKSSPHLWKDHEANAELGLDYEDVDKILVEMEKSTNALQIAKKLNISSRDVKKIMLLNKNSEHKRNLPPIAKLF